jgi:hypothetical protein
MGVAEDKTVARRFVGTINFVERCLPVRRGRQRDRFFYLLHDSAADCILVGSAAARACLVNVRAAGEDDFVLMNKFPARVVEYGDLRAEVQDDGSGEWVPLVLKKVMYVPQSRFDLIGFSAYQRQLEPGAKLVLQDKHMLLPVNGARGGSVQGRRRGGMFSVRARKPHVHELCKDRVPLVRVESKRGQAMVVRRAEQTVLERTMFGVVGMKPRGSLPAHVEREEGKEVVPDVGSSCVRLDTMTNNITHNSHSPHANSHLHPKRVDLERREACDGVSMRMESVAAGVVMGTSIRGRRSWRRRGGRGPAKVTVPGDVKVEKAVPGALSPMSLPSPSSSSSSSSQIISLSSSYTSP